MSLSCHDQFYSLTCACFRKEHTSCCVPGFRSCFFTPYVVQHNVQQRQADDQGQGWYRTRHVPGNAERKTPA